MARVDESLLSYCECGCGEATNEKHLVARRMRSNGWKAADIAAEWGCTPDWINQLCNPKKPFPRYIKGHYHGQKPGAWEQFCERCGTRMMCSTRKRFCGSYECVAAHTTSGNAWVLQAIRKTVNAGKDAQRERLKRFFAVRSMRIETRIRRARYKTDATYRRALDTHRAAVLAERRDKELKELAAWIAEQPDDVQAYIDENPDTFTYWISLDAALFVDSRRTLHEVLDMGYNPRGDAVEWHDPTADAALERASWAEASRDWDLLRTEATATSGRAPCLADRRNGPDTSTR